MRTLNPTLALASLVGFLTAASCTLITDVDRTKIPTDAGTEAEGGSGGTGGGTGGKGGAGGKGGTAGDGAGGTTAGTAGSGAMGGTAGTGVVTPSCSQAHGKITVNPVTFLSDGDTITLGDGVNAKVVFEFDLAPGDGVATGHAKIVFDGTENNFGIAALIADAITAQNTAGALRVTAAVENADTLGAAGASGASGASNGGAPNAGASNGGVPGGAGVSEGGSGPVGETGSAIVDLTNELSGALGNVKITDTVGNPNLSTSGMSGGKSVACDSPSSCKSSAECASEDCDDNNLCVPVQ